MASFNYKKYLPTALIIAGFFVIAILYSYPALSGKELSAGDNISWKGMSQEARSWYERTGEQVLWTNSMFGGMPTFTFFLAKTANYVDVIEKFFVAILPKPAFFFFLAMTCFFALMQVLGVNRWLSAIGAIAYTFATYNPIIIAAGHDTKMLSIAYMPGVLAGILLIYRGRWLSGMAVTGILFALMFQHQHVQILFYFMLILGGLGIGLFYIAYKEGKLKNFFIGSALTALVLALGAGPSMPGFLSTIEYSKETMRGGKSELTINHDKGKKSGGLDKDYAFQWSNGIGETFCILVPYLYGGASGEDASHAPATSEAIGPQYEQVPTYWGPQPFLSGPVYFGAVICFLFVLGMLVIRSPHKWWMGALCLLAIVMSWGKHFAGFNYFLFDTLPVMNKLRTPSMVLVIPQLLFSVVGLWGLQEVLSNYTSEEARKELWKKVKLAAGLTGGLALLLGVGGSMFFDFTDRTKDAQYEQILSFLKEDRAAMARNSGLLSAFYIAAAGGLIWAYLKNKLSAKLMIGGIALLVVIDLMPISWRYLNDKNFQDADQYAQAFTPSPTDAQILQMGKGDPYYRVLDLTKDIYNDARQAYFHKNIGGYNPAKLEIYQDLIDVHMKAWPFNPAVLNMLNTRFIVVPSQQQGGGGQVMPNAQACGNAWFVSNVRQVSNANEEMLFLGDTAAVTRGAGFNPLETAVVRNTFASQLQGLRPGKDSLASVRLAKYGLNEISYASSNSSEGLAVFSDIWYPHGWKAYVDGKEVPIIRANYVLRALRLPAGQHNIVFKFHPDIFYTGNAIAGLSSFLLYALLITGIVAMFRSKKSEEQMETAAQKETPPAKR